MFVTVKNGIARKSGAVFVIGGHNPHEFNFMKHNQIRQQSWIGSTKSFIMKQGDITYPGCLTGRFG